MVCGHDLAYNFASSATSTMESVVEFQRDQISKTLLKILEKKPFSPLIIIFLLELGSLEWPMLWHITIKFLHNEGVYK